MWSRSVSSRSQPLDVRVTWQRVSHTCSWGIVSFEVRAEADVKGSVGHGVIVVAAAYM